MTRFPVGRAATLLSSRPVRAPPPSVASGREKLYPRREATVANHTMGASLPRYLDMKVHQAVLEQPYDEITVVGAYTRTPPSAVFRGEKRDKPFNWQRPTARAAGNHLYIECFPGYDHVEHYAEIIATYLGIRQREGAGLTPPSRVSFHPLSCSDTQTALEATNLGHLPSGVDTVVLGLVHRLQRLTGPAAAEDWDENGCFDWTVRRFNGRSVAFVGFRPAFWGDIAGEVVHYLASRLGVREVLYFGKLGSVKKDVRPNTWLATGGVSHVRGQPVEWENALDTAVARLASDCTFVGNHLTVSSVLHETRDWLAALPASVDFVDPEIGMMAQAAARSGIRFGYLHIISDNVAEKYEEDLSNERMPNVLSRRSRLFDVVQDVLGHHLSTIH
ncbi:hypothetical protein HRG_000589 [Hirsutella rhossiliensis]|uniref:Uncharacterized protein n=1 Tax=Hirsutella rhossiliensis TaxID=111463 RepID=A0A9P8NB64_9HYPO|nr:uncharacterized protein HRG_00589 [Hirsutella rhossiliensis]KAH0967947.1 hypothetical protein HRG_00589 [Hirsutella rhossiliensis]